MSYQTIDNVDESSSFEDAYMTDRINFCEESAKSPAKTRAQDTPVSVFSLPPFSQHNLM